MMLLLLTVSRPLQPGPPLGPSAVASAAHKLLVQLVAGCLATLK